MRGRKRLDHILPLIRELNNHFSSVIARWDSLEEPFLHQSVDHPNRAVMFKDQTFGQLADDNRLAAAESFHQQESLMLLSGESGAAGSLFAKMEEVPEGVAK